MTNPEDITLEDDPSERITLVPTDDESSPSTGDTMHSSDTMQIGDGIETVYANPETCVLLIATEIRRIRVKKENG